MIKFRVVGDSKWETFKKDIRYKYEDAKIWCKAHKEEIMYVVVSVSIAVIPGLIKRGIRAIDLRKAKNVKELYCYDRSLGHYWRLRRELSNTEWLAIESRRAKGERLADILADLKVLK